jgi:spore coat protein CotF
MEMGNPGLREFLKDAFTMSCNHAFEVWQWMVSKGYYPIEPAADNALNTVGSIYKEVKTPVTI